MKPFGFERYAKFDRVGKKAYFTSTLFGRKASAFPLRQPDSGAGWFSPTARRHRLWPSATEMSARVGSGAWRSGWGRRHSFEFCINEKNKNQKEPFALGKSGKLRAMNLKGDGFYLSISTVLFTN